MDVSKCTAEELLVVMWPYALTMCKQEEMILEIKKLAPTIMAQPMKIQYLYVVVIAEWFLVCSSPVSEQEELSQVCGQILETSRISAPSTDLSSLCFLHHANFMMNNHDEAERLRKKIHADFYNGSHYGNAEHFNMLGNAMVILHGICTLDVMQAIVTASWHCEFQNPVWVQCYMILATHESGCHFEAREAFNRLPHDHSTAGEAMRIILNKVLEDNKYDPLGLAMAQLKL